VRQQRLHDGRRDRVQGLVVVGELRDEAGRVRLLRREQARPQQQVQAARRPELAHEQRDGVHRQAVAQGPRDRHAEAAGAGGDAQVARGGEGQPAADAGPAHDGDGRHRDVLEPVDDPGDAELVVDAVPASAEGRELRDVRAGHEGVARAGQDEDPDVVVGVGPLARGVQPLVHRERHGVARRGPVEDHREDTVREAHLQVVGHERTPAAPLASRASTSWAL